jgi:tetratricopeptide (TPR) repeat protein
MAICGGQPCGVSIESVGLYLKSSYLLNNMRYPSIISFAKRRSLKPAVVLASLSLGLIHAGELRPKKPATETPHASESKLEEQQEPGGGFGVKMYYVGGLSTITEVTEGSPGDQFGMRKGDHFLGINGIPLQKLGAEKIRKLGQSPAGTAVRVTIERGGEEMELTIIAPTLAAPTAENPGSRPEHAPALLCRAKVKHERQNAVGALKDLNTAIELNPKLTEAYTERGRIRQEQEEYQSALTDFTQAVKLQPDAFSFTLRGYVYELLEQPEKALTDYQAAIKLNPEYADPHCYVAKIKARQGDETGALKIIDQVLKFDPKSELAYCHRGQIHTDKRRYPEAIKDFSKALEIKPSAFTAELLGYAQFMVL